MEARLRFLSAFEPSKITFFSSNTILKTSIQSYSVLGAIIPLTPYTRTKKGDKTNTSENDTLSGTSH